MFTTFTWLMIMEQWPSGQGAGFPGVVCSKPLGGSKVDSAFHPYHPYSSLMSTRDFWELSGKK